MKRLQALTKRLEHQLRRWSTPPVQWAKASANLAPADSQPQVNLERLFLARSVGIEGASASPSPEEGGASDSPQGSNARLSEVAPAEANGQVKAGGEELLASRSGPEQQGDASLQDGALPVLVQQSVDVGGGKRSEACRNPADFGDRSRRRTQSATLFGLAVVGLTSLIGQRLYDQPALDVGKHAPQTIYAPRDATVMDQKLTQERRREATIAAIPVLKVDSGLNLEQLDGLVRTFRHGNELRSQLGRFPVVDTGLVSSDVQRHVRQLPDKDWNWIRQEAKASIPRFNGVAPLGQKAIVQLNALGKRGSGAELRSVELKFQVMRRQYLQAKVLLQDADLVELNAAYTPLVFELSDSEWEQLKTATKLALERILIQGIAPGLSADAVQEVIALHLDLAIPRNDDPLVTQRLRAVATPILGHVLKPNLVQDPFATQRQAEQAASNVEPVMVSIREDDAIVEAGQEITPAQLVLLDEFKLSERGPNWIGLLGLGGIIWVEVSLVWLIQRRIGPGFRRRDWLLVGILAATTPLLFVLRLPVNSLPAVGLLVGSFYGSPLGVAVVGLLAIALPIGLELETQALIASAASGVVGALVAGRLRSREELALLGLGVGLTQCIVHLLVSLILSGATGLLWLIFLRSALSHALRGIAWSVVALGVSPYLERLFDLITPIRMAELSNPNRPLLQRLASETPGTFQHTLFVSTLAEAAARALGCNVELIRAGTLYHDIGKMHDPQGFIENQMGGTNKHDVLNDPWKSAAIIKKHVTEGQVMARRSSLPRALRNFIPEHQGTMRISYFYQQAQKLAAEEPERYSLNEADFRYDGPIPQSRETGIVMLADSCEAALRSLKDATSEEALNMVKKIIRARWKDEQLCDSGLSKQDLETIAMVFVQIWQQFHHKRIPYPTNTPPISPTLSPS